MRTIRMFTRQMFDTVKSACLRHAGCVVMLYYPHTGVWGYREHVPPARYSFDSCNYSQINLF